MDLSKLEKLAFAFWKKSQDISFGDDPYLKALIEHKVMGMAGSPNNFHFDTNSQAAQQIMNLVGKYQFNGTIDLNLVVPGKDDKALVGLQVVCNPDMPQLSTAIQNQFAGQVASVTKGLDRPATTYTKTLTTLNFS